MWALSLALVCVSGSSYKISLRSIVRFKDVPNGQAYQAVAADACVVRPMCVHYEQAGSLRTVTASDRPYIKFIRARFLN